MVLTRGVGGGLQFALVGFPDHIYLLTFWEKSRHQKVSECDQQMLQSHNSDQLIAS